MKQVGAEHRMCVAADGILIDAQRRTEHPRLGVAAVDPRLAGEQEVSLGTEFGRKSGERIKLRLHCIQ